MDNRLRQLEEDISYIKKRNKRVEADKAWETSATRMLSILVLTYVFASAALYFIGAKNVFLNSIIPTLGYFLSTQSLPFIKKWWVSKHCK